MYDLLFLSALRILYLSCLFSVFTMIWFLWSCLLSVLYASCTWIVIPFCRFGKLSAMTLLKIISVILAWNSSMPMNHGFGFFTVFYRHWMFCSYLTIVFHFPNVPVLLFICNTDVLSSLWSASLEAVHRVFIYLREAFISSIAVCYLLQYVCVFIEFHSRVLQWLHYFVQLFEFSWNSFRSSCALDFFEYTYSPEFPAWEFILTLVGGHYSRIIDFSLLYFFLMFLVFFHWDLCIWDSSFRFKQNNCYSFSGSVCNVEDGLECVWIEALFCGC